MKTQVHKLLVIQVTSPVINKQEHKVVNKAVRKALNKMAALKQLAAVRKMAMTPLGIWRKVAVR